MGQLVSDVTNILDYKDKKGQAEATKKEALMKIVADEKEKTNLVKKVLATQRAKYGASGRMGNGQTEEKVLARLKKETEAPYEAKKQANLGKIKKAQKANLLTMALKHFDKLIG